MAPAEFGRALFCLASLGKPQTGGPRRDQIPAHTKSRPAYPSLKDIWSNPFLEQGYGARRGTGRDCAHPGSAVLTCFCQGGRHLVLGGVDVTGRPAALRSQSTQRLDQHLRDSGVSHSTSTARAQPCATGSPELTTDRLQQTLPWENAGSRTSLRGYQKSEGASTNSPRLGDFRDFPLQGKAGLSHPRCPKQAATHRSLCCNVCTAYNFSSSQRLLPLSSLPE